MSLPFLSIVTSTYYSEQFLEDFIVKCENILKYLNIEFFEFVFVIDGETDNSKILLLNAQERGKPIKIIEFSRNFGHHHALLAGLQYAKGTHIYLTDCDLEVSPSVISDFYNKLLETKSDVVYGYRTYANSGIFCSIISRLFWKIFNFLSEIKIQDNVVTERLMTRQYLNALLRLNDKNIFLGGLMYWVGFEQIGIPILKNIRAGKSNYKLTKKIALMVNAITSFSGFPLRILLYLGTSLTAFSSFVALTLIIVKMLIPNLILPGFTAIITTILFSTGLLIFSIGLLGIYIEKVFIQVKNRPDFIIKRIYDY